MERDYAGGIEMKSVWKKGLATLCAAAMLITMPGMCVLADEMAEEELIITEIEDPDEALETADSPVEDVTDDSDAPIAEENIDQEEVEEAVGEGPTQVGDGVTATFDADTGAVEFVSQDGELWRDWVEKLGVDRDSIKSIRVASGTVYLPSNSSGYVDYKFYMFSNLGELTSLDLSSFDTSNVTDMSKMFYYCRSLTNLDLSSFDTSNVTDMRHMFSDCRSLTNLDVSSFDTSNVSNMGSMFDDCRSLTNLDVSSFDTSKVTNMEFMFLGCASLTNLDVSSFDTSKVTSMRSMFYHCKSLTNLDLSSFDTSNVTDMSYMFYGGDSLTNLDLSSFDTSKVTNMESMFLGFDNLTNLDLSSFDTSKVTNMSYMFFGCNSLTNLDLSSFNTSNVTDMSYMFSGCNSLTKLDLSSFNTSNVTDMSYMFYFSNNIWDNSSLTNLDLSSFDTSKVTNMEDMFARCRSLINLDLSSFDTSKVTDMSYMFLGCNSLTKLDLSSFDTSNVTDMSYMFLGCNSLTKLDLSSFNTSNVTYMSHMFWGCSSLTKLDLSSFDTSNVTDMSHMFDDCGSLTNLDLSSFNTSKVWYMLEMFSCCGSLTNLDLSSFDMSHVRRMDDMFHSCFALERLKTPKKNEKSVELPVTMYDEAGNEYEDLPLLSESIVLTRNKPTTELYIYDCEITLSETSYTFDGKAKEPTVTVMDGSTILNSGKDYIVSYANNINPGTATVKVTGIGNYRGEKYVTFMIDGENWIDNTGIPHYYTIALQATSTGRYITCDVGAKNAQGRYENMDYPDLNANATRVMAYEEFELVPCSDGSYALRSVMNRKYITCYSCCLFTPDANGKLVKEDWVLRCDSDFVRDGSMTVEKKSATYGFSCDYVETAYLKLYLSEDSSGNKTLKFKNGDRWLCVEDGKLCTTNTVTNAELFKLILLDDNQYIEDERTVLSRDEWFNIDNRGFGGLYDIQCDVGENSQYNAHTLKNLGYTPMNLKSQFMEHDYIQIDKMQCFVAYKKDNDKYDIIIAFQGTNGYGFWDMVNDGLSNLTGSTYTDEDGMHAGYHQMAMKLEENKDNVISINNTGLTLSDLISAAKNYKASFTILGHSMGGAIAQCYALYLLQKEQVPVSQIRGRTFNSALAVNSDYEEFSKEIDWYNICVSSDSVSNGLVPGSIIYYGIHRLGKTIWLYDLNPDDNNPDGVANISDNKHVMDNYACLHTLLYQAYSTYRCNHEWGEGIVRTVILDGKEEFERISTCTKCEQIKIEDLMSVSNHIEVSGLKSMVYTGMEITPHFVVKYGTKTLEENVDYEVTYKNNINAGTATVTITGKGNYAGTVSKNFKIKKATTKLVFAESTVTKKTTDVAFTNTLTKTTDGTVTFTSSDTKVAEVNSTSGLVTIKGVGTATITATASEGKNYKAGSAGYTLTVKASAATGFSDVQDPSHPYYKAIYWAAGEGITKGYSDGTFGINRSCTRGEMMMFLWKYAGKPAPKAASKSPFKDVSTSHSFYKAILWGYQNGITKGYSDGSFGINRYVSRGESMMFLWKLKGKPAPKAVSKSPFKDVPTSHAFYKAILWGSQKGITKGYTSGSKKGTFGINDNCTRGQIVTFLYRAK